MYSYTTRVRFSELAEDKKASFVSIINYFQDCCTFESEDCGVGLAWLAEHKTSWMLTGWQVYVIRRPKYCEEVRVTTWACGFKRFIGKRSFLLSTLDGEPLVYALSDWAYVNIETGRPERSVPEKEVDAYGLEASIDTRFEEFGIDPAASEEMLTGKIKLPENMEARTPITVTADNLDTNHHVNNGQYVAFAKSVIPEEIEIKKFRAEYKKQSKLGDTIYPYIVRDDEKITVVLNDEEGATKLITEFYI